MPSNEAIRRELQRAEREVMKAPYGSRREAELYGVQQALAWVLGEDVMAPVKCALTPARETVNA